MAESKFLKSKKIKLLKKYFEKEKSVVLAFLFGSWAKGFEKRESDFDIAIYLKDQTKENKISLEIARIVGKDVDLIDLNEAPASLVWNIFETGIPLAVKDNKLYWELYLRKSSEGEDFLKFAEDFWRIYKRAKSLILPEKNRFLERFQFLDLEMKELDKFKKLSFQEYRDDKDKRRIVERWTENIINATIDIAKIILASEKQRMPKDYEGVLYHFGALVGMSEREAERFSKLANLRNILAHEYLDILYKKIQNFIREYPKSYKKIFDFLEKYLK